METGKLVGNANLTTAAMATALVGSENDTAKLVRNEYEADELTTLECTTEYLDENRNDEFSVTEQSVSEMRSNDSTDDLEPSKTYTTRQLPCKSDIFICGLCMRKFTYPHPIQRHMLETHMTQKPRYKCSCDEATSYATIDELLLHKVQYADVEKHIKCNLCPMFFTTIKDLAQHKSMKTFSCSKCRIHFDDCSLLHKHWRHVNTVGLYKCDMCSFTSSSCIMLKNHRSANHCRKGPRKQLPHRKQHTCDICQKVYRKQYQLRQHRKLHDSVFLMYKCETCRAMFDSDSSWRQHKCAEVEPEAEDSEAKAKDSEAKTRMQTMYQCNFCKDTFFKPIHLKNHMSSSHYVNVDSQMDMLSCLKKINVLSAKHPSSAKQPPKPKAVNVPNGAVESSTPPEHKSKNAKKTPKIALSECDIAINAIKAELSSDEKWGMDASDATASQAFLGSLMEWENPSEAADAAVKTEDYLVDVDNEDFEDDIIILDTDNSIQFKKEEPATPERGETLQSIDEYLGNTERVHTFSITIERVEQVAMHVVKQEEVILPGPNGDSSVAINQLLKVRNIYKRKVGRPRYQCTNVGCNKVFVMKMEMKRHVVNMECMQSSEPPHYQCLRCGVATGNILLYMKHWENHGFSEDQCPSCLVNVRGYLVQHIEEHIKESFDSKRSRCHECKFPVMPHSKLQHWESHVLFQDRRGSKLEKLKPTSALPKNCSACLKSFQRVSDLKRHLVEHVLRAALRRKGRNEGLKCEICKDGALFATISAFKQHWRDHAGLRVYKCKICAKMFADSSNFTKHKKVHDLNSMQCDTCGRKFASRRMLIQHMEYHETNKPLKCSVCGEVFHFLSALTKHFKIKHSLQRDFKCIYCYEGFLAWRDLRNHLWVQHGVRKFNADCQICGWQCRTYMQLRAHCKLKHDIVISAKKKQSSKMRAEVS